MKKRLDLYLAEKKIASSRTKAQDLIKGRSVLVNGKHAENASILVSDQDRIELQDSDETKYVSRGGIKLENALLHCRCQVEGLHILDVGISTGGFTDCLLKAGAAGIVGVDVGQNQLHQSLRQNSKIRCLEKTNARNLQQNSEVLSFKPGGGWPMAVIDVSFISLKMVLPSVFDVLAENGVVLALVKPQFEVGAEGLNRQGVVKDAKSYPIIEESIKNSALGLGFQVLDYFASVIEGKDGNKEFFIYLKKSTRLRG